MPDFTSVLYLGMRHPHHSLAPWGALTTGRPDALEPSRRSARLAARLAEFTGHEAALIAGSTLHLFWDLFDGLARERIVIHLDAGTYPIARWGVERVAARGVPVIPFPRHDAQALRSNLAREGALRPVVVADGVCPLTGRPAPLADYALLCRAFGAVLVVDDTQGIGLFGSRPTGSNPYGEDGAGTPAWCGALGCDLLVASSLAKAFGAPLAVIAGRRSRIDTLKATSLTRIHCSPASMAAISAAEAALTLNAAEGPARRRRLLALICLFQDGLARLGLTAHGGCFPFQTLDEPRGAAAIDLHGRLLGAGVRSVLHRAGQRGGQRGGQMGGQRGGQRGGALISFVLTCLHTPPDIAFTLQALATCCHPPTRMHRIT